MATFLAELDGKVAGSVACQLQQLPYPDVVVPAFRKHGYIWSVYVEPASRRRGVARALVTRAVGYLRSAVLRPSCIPLLPAKRSIDSSDFNQRPKCVSIYDATNWR